MGIRPGREDLAAEMAAQLLQLVDLGLDGRLACDPHQHPGAGRLVNRALLAVRAGIARLKRLVRYPDLLGAAVGVRPVAAMASARRRMSCSLSMPSSRIVGFVRIMIPATAIGENPGAASSRERP